MAKLQLVIAILLIGGCATETASGTTKANRDTLRMFYVAANGQACFCFRDSQRNLSCACNPLR